ncbi:unnamed protein product, partial [Symbiodinium sp. KB8]
MGKGSAKGKKGGAASCPGSPKCVSEEVQPRHYVYVGKVPASSVDPTGATGKGKHAKGSKGASKGDAEKGKGKSSGKATDKGKGYNGGKPSGSSPPSGKGHGDPNFETPTPKRRNAECLASGTPPTRPDPNQSPTHAENDPKPTKGASQKGVAAQGGKGNKGGEEQAQAAKGVKGAAVDGGAKNALDPKGKGQKGTTKGAAHHSDGNGSNGGYGSMASKGKGKTKGPGVDQNAGTKGAADPSIKGTRKGAVDGGTKGAVDEGVKGGLDHKGKGKKGTAKGADQSGGKGSKGADAVDASRDTSVDHGAMDQMSGKDKKGDQAGKGEKGDQSGKGKTKCDQSGKGKTKCDQSGKTKCDQAGKGKTKCDQSGKGKTKCDQAKGKKGATDQDGHQKDVGKRVAAESGDEYDRRVWPILRSDTGISTLSDGQGAIQMQPLATRVDAQRIPDEAYGKGSWPNGFEFLKAFLLDRENLSSIKVEPYYEELSETQEKETYTELPLCLIKEKYEHLPGGQTGKRHPQSDSDNMMIYKVFDSVKTSSASINRCGNRTSAAMSPSNNKAERHAIAEVLEAKAASMMKPTTGKGLSSKGKGKGKAKGK